MLLLLFIAAPIALLVWRRFSRKDRADLPDEHALQRGLLAAGWVCALGAFAALAMGCFAQFEPEFSTRDAQGAFILAVPSALLATIISFAAFFAGTRRRGPLRLLIGVWVGFFGFIVLGVLLYDTARAVRLRSKPNPALERTPLAEPR